MTIIRMLIGLVALITVLLGAGIVTKTLTVDEAVGLGRAPVSSLIAIVAALSGFIVARHIAE